MRCPRRCARPSRLARSISTTRRHAHPAQAQLGGRRQGLLRQQRPAQLGRHRVRPVPLHRRQLVRAGHRSPARRLGQPRPRRRRDHRRSPPTCSRSPRCSARTGDGAQGARRLGAGKVRRRALPRRQGVPAGRDLGGRADPARVRSGRRQPAHLDRGLGLAPYWNALVANLEMHGKGSFFDSRMDDPTQFPIAAAHPESLATARHRWTSSAAKLPGAAGSISWRFRAPRRPRGRSTRRRRRVADALFSGKAACSSCHVEPRGRSQAGTSTPGSPRSGSTTSRPCAVADHLYRTAPLAGLWTHQKGGFYHDGRFADARGRVAALRRRLRPRSHRRRAKRPGGIPEVAARRGGRRRAVSSGLTPAPRRAGSRLRAPGWSWGRRVEPPGGRRSRAGRRRTPASGRGRRASRRACR